MHDSSTTLSANLATLARCKQTLHEHLPLVKSSHLSEILAAALGYSTNAALLAKLKEPGSTLSMFSLDIARFHRRAEELGYELKKAYAEVGITAGLESALMLQNIHTLAQPENLTRSAIEQCRSYGIQLKQAEDGNWYAWHLTAGATASYLTQEEAAAAARNAWL